MEKLLGCRNVAIMIVVVVAFSLHQFALFVSVNTVKEDAHTYLRGYVPNNTERSRETNFTRMERIA